MLSSLRAVNMENDLKIIPDYGNQNYSSIISWCFQVFFMFNPVFGEMIQFNWYVWNGLKPPTRISSLSYSWAVSLKWFVGCYFFQHVKSSLRFIFGDPKHVMFLATPKKPTNLLRRLQKIDSNDVFWGKSWTPGRNRCVGIPFRVHHCCLHLLADPWFIYEINQATPQTNLPFSRSKALLNHDFWREVR